MADAFQSLPESDQRGAHRYSLTIGAYRDSRPFVDADLVATLLTQIRHVARQERFDLLAYCFMPDQLHLVVESQSETADLLSFVNGWKPKTGFYYASRTGMPLWQPAALDCLLLPEESADEQIEQVLAHPVRAGLAQVIGEYPFARVLRRADEHVT
jgi:putative transposase